MAIVSVTANDNAASERAAAVTQDPGQFTISRDVADSVPLIVDFQLSGTAAHGTDYSAISGVWYDSYAGVYKGSVTIPANQTSVTIDIQPINDANRESSESVNLTLISSSCCGGCCGCGGGYSLGTASSASITIADNDNWAVAVEVTDATAAERGSGEPQEPGQFTIARSGETDLTNSLTVYFQLAGTATHGGDYSSLSGVWYDYYAGVYKGTVTIAAGQATATIAVQPINDAMRETDETVNLTLVADTSNNAYTLASATTAQVVLADNDDWTVSVQASDAEAAEPNNPGQFTITRSGSTDLANSLSVMVQITGTAAFGSDYSSISGLYYDYSASSYRGTLTISAGQTSLAINLQPIDDTIVETSETAVLTILSDGGCCGCGAAAYSIGTPSSATVTLADDDAANVWAVSIQATDATASERGSGETQDPGQVTITRSGQGSLSSPLTVSYQIGGTAAYASDYSSLPDVWYNHAVSAYQGTVTIPANQTSVTLSIAPINDAQRETSESVSITLIAPSGCGCGSGNYSVSTPAAATVSISDNDDWTVAVQATDAEAGEPNNSGQFTITRSGSTDLSNPLPVTVQMTGSASFGSDYSCYESLIQGKQPRKAYYNQHR